MAVNECLAVVQNELDAVEAPYIVDPSAKHIKVSFKVKGTVYTAVVPKTASDWRSVKNSRAEIRRMIRDAGLSPSSETPNPKAPKVPKEVSQMGQHQPLSLIVRVERLEAEVKALTDLLMEIKR